VRLNWPPEDSTEESAIAFTEDRCFVQIVERIDAGSLGNLYRLDGYPGLHEERYLEKVSDDEVMACLRFAFTPELPLVAIAIPQPFVFAIGEIVQIGDIDDEEERVNVAYRYGMITAQGFDRDGLYYVVGFRNDQGVFVDSKYEFEEDELLKVDPKEQASLKNPERPASSLTLVSSR